MLDRLESHISLQRTALNTRVFRQELLASNIANADTPHFKARDIDFKQALQGEIERKGGIDLRRTSPRHLEGVKETGFGPAVKYRTEYQSAVDGNTVDMDIERSAFAENNTRMQAGITFVRELLKEMSAAVQQ